MAYTTPDEWLPVLTKRLDDRQARVARLRSYANGDAPMPEMGHNTRASWEKFQKTARGGFGYLIASALASRIVPLGVTVGGATEGGAADAAQRIYRDNRVNVAIKDALQDAFEASIGYLLVGRDDDGRAVVTREKPEYMIAATDPLYPWRARAALKVWRDPDDGFDYAYVWVEGERQKFRRPSVDGRGVERRAAEGDWEAVGDPETYDGRPPVVVLENRDGLGEYERHTDAIDRIHLGILNRLVIVAMQAYRQRALKKSGDTVLPETTPDGQKIDYEKVFEPAPGALWDLPEGVEIWESSPTDIQQLLNAVKDDLRDLSAASETPLAMLVPDGANQSASGADFAREPITFKAKDRIARFSAPLAMAIVYALRVEGFDDVPTVEIVWEPAEWVSLTEKYAAAKMAKEAGESWKSIARNILGYSPDQIRQDELDRAEEQLAAATLIRAVGGGGGAAPVA